MAKNQLDERAAQLFPGNAFMQKQWKTWTRYLYKTGKHVLLSGAYPGATHA